VAISSEKKKKRQLSLRARAVPQQTKTRAQRGLKAAVQKKKEGGGPQLLTFDMVATAASRSACSL
jgi:hypothetical protein